MLFLLIGIVVVVVIASVVSAIGYYSTRKLWREQKNYERGLKMVPLLIHLPPQSSDTEIGARDERDVTDETISKATILYNIIASTVQKGFKSRFYGQRHFAFEIVGQNGFVHFYAAVPVALVEVVEQAVTSAYPTARLEEVAEHNIFNTVGRSSGTMGGELILKENSAYPIATYQELKRSTMQSILNALSTLEKEDGAGIQILFRPTDGTWRKNALSLADRKRKGTDKKKGGKAVAGSLVKDLVWAVAKPPEPKEKKPEDKQLSGSDQAIIDAIEEKARHSTFEVLIRIVASSNVSSRAQTIKNNLVATFALFDSPGRNGFKFTEAKDIDSFITAFIMRFFPQEMNKSVLNTIELATIFHFPAQSSIPTTQLERQASKQADGPRNVPDSGLMLGYNVFRGTKKRINLSPDDRRRHVYVVGQTGTGKSNFLENLALQDMLNGDGFAFIDPHGDTAEKLLSMVPKERTEDVVYFCPADMDYPLGLNLFEFQNPEQKDFIIQEAINMLYKLYDPQRQGIIGPRFERIFTNAAQLLMADPQGGTFIDVPKLLIDADFMKAKLKYTNDQNVLDFWTKEWPNSQRSNEAGEVTSWVVSKFGAFLSNEMMRNIVGQTKSSFNMREIMDKKKILLVNLSKGRLGELNSKLLGMIFVMKFQAAAMDRANIPEDERKDFSLFVDEFQNFSTDSFATILSEARKYRLNLIVANQFTTQLTDEIRDAVFGNVGTIVSFRVGTADAEFLAKQFAPVFDMDDLQRVPNYNTIVRMLIMGVPTQPFSMATLPPLGSPNKELGDALKQLSAAKFGRPRAIVEKEIFARIASPVPSGPAAAGPAAPPVAQPQRPSTGSSFLDDWLAKKQTNSFRAPASPFSQNQVPPTQPQPPVPTASPSMQFNGAQAPIPSGPLNPMAAPIAPQSFVAPVNSQPQPISTPMTTSPQSAPTSPMGPQEFQSQPQPPVTTPKPSEFSTNQPVDHTVSLR